jgi:multidrug resistance efflux pump
MTAPSSFTDTHTPTPQDLLNDFRVVQERLIEAQCTHAHALQNCNHAKWTLDLARAKVLVRGVEGKNEAVREAQIRLELDAQFEAVAEAEDELNEARCNLDATRLEWDGLRYTLRCLELADIL